MNYADTKHTVTLSGLACAKFFGEIVSNNYNGSCSNSAR